jgi:cysteine sulfinate desulfinase/cysteine desulfurase-like protein
MHAALGTLSLGGTIRFSIGPFSTEADVLRVISAMDELSTAFT